MLLGAGASVVLDAGPGGWVRVQIVSRREKGRERSAAERQGLGWIEKGRLGATCAQAAGGCGSTAEVEGGGYIRRVGMDTQGGRSAARCGQAQLAGSQLRSLTRHRHWNKIEARVLLGAT